MRSKKSAEATTSAESSVSVESLASAGDTQDNIAPITPLRGRKRGGRTFLIEWRNALRESELSPSARLVGFVLSTHMSGAGGSCFPKIATIAMETGLSRATVTAALKELEGSVRERDTKTEAWPWNASQTRYIECRSGKDAGRANRYVAILPGWGDYRGWKDDRHEPSRG